jgi:hypothetical protein
MVSRYGDYQTPSGLAASSVEARNHTKGTTMKPQFRKLAGAVVGMCILLAASSMPAAAQGPEPESLTGVIVVSGASGARTVASSVVVARGAFRGLGRILERDNLPGDPDNVSRDDLVFAEGTLHIVNVNVDVSVNVDPKTCKYSVTAKQTTRVDGGTGRLSHASGSFASTVNAHGVGRRGIDGSCAPDQEPLSEVDYITSHGTLSI